MQSVKWSSDVSSHKLGHPLIHRLIARIMWAEANVEQARHHYLLSRDGAGCGRMLIELSRSKGAAGELDLFVAQCVLQQLCLKEHRTAAMTFATYAEQHPSIGRTDPPFALPLLNFVYYLLECCSSVSAANDLPIFRALCAAYKSVLERDPSFDKYLQQIGSVYFGATTVQRRGGGGLFGDLITQLFAGFEDGDEDLEEEDVEGAANGNGAVPTVDLDVD